MNEVVSYLLGLISIHAPAGGATDGTQRWTLYEPDDFNSRPCGRGDETLTGKKAVLLNISIHAPAGGATIVFQVEPHCKPISIHAPAGGATLPVLLAEKKGLFQFTPLREGRPTLPRHIHQYSQFQFTPLREGRRWC